MATFSIALQPAPWLDFNSPAPAKRSRTMQLAPPKALHSAIWERMPELVTFSSLETPEKAQLASIETERVVVLREKVNFSAPGELALDPEVEEEGRAEDLGCERPSVGATLSPREQTFEPDLRRQSPPRRRTLCEAGSEIEALVGKPLKPALSLRLVDGTLINV
jgi:hypothetical protein